jgi:hypothetical protein
MASWSRKFDEPITLPGGQTLFALLDAGETTYPQSPHFQDRGQSFHNTESKRHQDRRPFCHAASFTSSVVVRYDLLSISESGGPANLTSSQLPNVPSLRPVACPR